MPSVPFKAVGYPVIPVIYIIAVLFIMIVLAVYKPLYTWPGLIIVALGIPVYFIWKKAKALDLPGSRPGRVKRLDLAGPAPIYRGPTDAGRSSF